MKRSRFTETQIVSILREADAGASVNDSARRHGISDNEERPHESLGPITPAMFRQRIERGRSSDSELPWIRE